MKDNNSTQDSPAIVETDGKETETVSKGGFDLKKILPFIIIIIAVIVISVIALTLIFGKNGNGKEDETQKNNNAHVHSASEPKIENETKATCLMDGSYDENVYCSACNEIISSERIVIPKSDHTDNGEGLCTVCKTPFKPNSKLSYRIYEAEGYAEVKGYSGNSNVVLIADSFEGYPVKAIGYRAFWENLTVTEIIIPEGVTQIKAEAFVRCKNLKFPTLPSSLVTIGKTAFSECDSITSLRIPGKFSTIDDYVFYNCNNLKYVIFEEGVEYINQCAFGSCNKLTYIVLPKSIKHIKQRAFLESDNQKRIYYFGSRDDFYDIKIDAWNNCIKKSTWYYYSESQPVPHETIKYWHYNDKGKIVIWE